MSFLKGADRDFEFNDVSNAKTTMEFGPTQDEADDYPEWDMVTTRMEKNFEITPEAADYNNGYLDESSDL